MQVLVPELPARRGPTTVRTRERPTAGAKVAIGTFDGVHLGHRQVLYGCDTVLTFDPHPLQVVGSRHAPSLLSDRAHKLHKLAALGIQRVAVIPFDEAWSRVSAEDFIEQVVLGQLGAQLVSVGEGFRFGAHGAGTPDVLKSFPELTTRVVPLLTWGRDAEPISSTRIRRLVFEGEVEQATELLGAPLTLPAMVGENGQLLIGVGFARPAPGLYLGYVDSHPCAIRVCPDMTFEVLAGFRPGTQVEVTFVKRAA